MRRSLLARALDVSRACTSICLVTSFAFAGIDERSSAAQSELADPPVPVLTPEITRAELEAHVRTLASDAMQGRATGTAGGERAANYLARAMAATGVEPGGDDGSYLRAVELRRTRARSEPVLTFKTHTGEAVVAVYGRDYTAAIEPAKVEDFPVRVVRDEQELVAKATPTTALFVDASPSKRDDWLKRSGHPRGVGLGLYLQSGSIKAGEPASVAGDASALLRSRESSENPHWVRLRGPMLQRVRDSEFATVSFVFDVVEENITAHNVVGWVRGVGAKDRADLANEAIVLTAHYDHLGERAPGSVPPKEGAGTAPPEDLVYNGADDDASGCAAVLELAGLYAHGAKPARSIIFLLVTGEEIGLLGTEEYLDRPLVPLERTVVNLNFEMVGRPDAKVGGAGVMWFTGHELSNLGPAFVAAGLAVRPDPRPEQNFFERSDNFAFVRRGVVGQSFSTYDLHSDYHRPDDEADRIDYAHLETCTRVAGEAVRMIADGRLRPSWNQTSSSPSSGH